MADDYARRTSFLTALNTEPQNGSFQNALHFCDKMPTNYKAIPFIRKLLPEARIIVCLRHPFALAWSCYRQLFVEAAPWSYDLDELADMVLAFEALIEAYRVHWGDKVHILVHERLLLDPEHELRTLLQFLGLPWQETCLHPEQNPAPCRTLSAVRIRSGLSRRLQLEWPQTDPSFTRLLERLRVTAQQYESRHDIRYGQ